MFCPACQSEYPADWKRCPTDEHELLGSRHVGKYRIEGVLGIGGMGAVYRAVNPDTRAVVAIKRMHGGAGADAAARARFEREAAAVATLRTQHVARIFDFGEADDGSLFLVMEHLDGHLLRAEIGTPAAPLPLPRVHLLFDGALRGLAAAHRVGIVHRDLKPENIFVASTDDGEVAKILDFGIARFDTRDDRKLTQSGTIVGTPAYMAPEQIAAERDDIGPATDVYAMGVVGYELLASTIPFSGDTVTAVMAAALAGDHRPLEEVRPDLPAEIHRFFRRALAVRPASRFADADAMRQAWTDAFASVPATVRDAPVPAFRGAATAATRPLRQPEVAKPPPARGATALGHASTITPEAAGQAHAPEAAGQAHKSAVPPTRRLGLIIGSVTLAVAGIGAAWLMTGRSSATAAPPDAGPLPTPADAASARPDAGPPPGMVAVPGGRFAMGLGADEARGFPAADPRHEVEVAPFWLDRHEMTVAGYRAATGGDARGDAALPVVEVTWTEAREACAALGKRLPGEAEWELVATRAALDPAGARMRGPGVHGPAPVGTHAGDCTPEGICDLLGNVSEWTADRWRQDGTLDGDPDARAVRGGSFSVSPTARFYASPWARMRVAADTRDPEVGFRCARDAR